MVPWKKNITIPSIKNYHCWSLVDSIYCSSRTGTISPNKSGFYLPTMCCVEIIAQWDHLTILLSTWPPPRCVSIIRRNQNILRRPQVQYRTQCNQISVTTQQHKTKIVGSRSDSSWIEISFDQHQVIAADAGCESFVNSLSFNAGDFMSWMFLEKCLLGIKFWDNGSCHCHCHKNMFESRII